jgi:hypothetical protein
MEFLTVDRIIAHRAARKESGLAGCKDGGDALPGGLTNMRGISWRPMNPMNPTCFCHDCRTQWDPTGSIDLELLKQGNTRALLTYASILPNKKELLSELRCKTDDALENMVKTQSFLMETSNMLRDSEHDLESKRSLYEYLTVNQLSHNSTSEEARVVGSQIDKLTRKVAVLKEKVDSLEECCRSMTATYTNARKAEMEFLDKNF